MEMSVFLLKALKTLLENSPDLMFIKDENLVYKGASKVFTDMVGLEKNTDIINKTDYDIFDKALAEKYINDDKLVLSSGIPLISLVEPIPEQGGRKRYSSTSKYIIKDEKGNSIGLIGVGCDVTASVELETVREHSNISNQMFDDILEADITNDRMINNSYSSLSSQLNLLETVSFSEAGELFARAVIHEDYQKEFIEKYNIDRVKESYDNGINEFNHITYMKVKDDYKWYEFSSKLYFSLVSNSLRIITFLRDVDKKVKDSALLKEKAETDPLTGLWNRRNVSDKIKEYMSKNSDRQCALLFIDLDYFKVLNDSKGHVFGDKVLKVLARILEDSFSSNGYIGRLGGDEFIIFLKNINSEKLIESMVNSFFGNMRDLEVEGFKYELTCSVGIAIQNENQKSFEQLYDEADLAMYRAKALGRNRIAFYK